MSVDIILPNGDYTITSGGGVTIFRPIIPGGGGGSSTLLNNLVAYWPLDETSGNRADATGRGNTLVQVGTLGSAAGKVNNATTITFPNYGTCASNADLSLSNSAFTVAGWIYMNNPSAVPGGKVILSKWNTTGNQREWLLFYNRSDHVPNNVFSFVVSANGTAFTTIDGTTFGSATAATWYFVAAYHDNAGSIGISVNGGAWQNAAFTGPTFNGTAPVMLGDLNNGGVYPTEGRLDEIGLWKRKLTDSEIAQLYNSGAGRTYPFT